jgi:transcriptional regulator with GAF, ATPase, and Fis domain
MVNCETCRDRFLTSLGTALSGTGAEGASVFDCVARACLAHLGSSCIALAVREPGRARARARVEARGQARGLGDLGDLALAAFREWDAGGTEPETLWQVTDPYGVWAAWPMRQAEVRVGALLVQWPTDFRPSLPPVEAFSPALQLATALVGRSLTLEALRHAQAELMDENEYLREEIRVRFSTDRIVYVSGRMEEVCQKALRVAASSATVLLHGETGTGKELVAHLIHTHSPRSTGPFIRVNCAALPENLLESELFGHVRGAFTGATYDRKGRFEAADGGTIFLDEIGDVSPRLQVRLLRVLQERELERVGETSPRQIDVRVVAATNRDLEQDLADGRFREDLYYRLNVVYLHIPPLRDRPEDIIPLAEHFLDQYNRENFKQLRLTSPTVIRLLREFAWPGNVRQLQNCMQKAVVLAPGDDLTLDLLPSPVVAGADRVESVPHPNAPLTPGELAEALVDHCLEGELPAEGNLYREVVAQVESPLLRKALERTRGNQLAASRALGINRNTMHKKARDHGLLGGTDADGSRTENGP